MAFFAGYYIKSNRKLNLTIPAINGFKLAATVVSGGIPSALKK
jgi:hypothetical protein